MATIIEQLASNSDFIARFKDDSKKAIQALIDTKQIAEDAHMVKRSPTLSTASTDTSIISTCHTCDASPSALGSSPCHLRWPSPFNEL
jgi:hypothetical protein